MTKFLKTLLILLIPFFGNTQTEGVPQSIYYSPKQYNKGNWGSFWIKIERTDYTYNGYYWYHIYAKSNSYLNSDINRDSKYDKATTYIEYPTVRMTYQYYGDKNYTFPMSSALFDWEWTKICYFYTVDPKARFYFTWVGVYPFSYSRIVK